MSNKEIKYISITDLGTNTFHHKIFSYTKNNIKLEYEKNYEVKLGYQLELNNKIDQQKVQKAIETLNDINTCINQYNTNIISYYIGTDALRKATNSKEVLFQLEKYSKSKIQIISGEEEASLIYEGNINSKIIQKDKTYLLVDIGGGSVEFILFKNKENLYQNSFEVGGIRLFEKYIQNDPITPPEINNIKSHLEKTLNSFTSVIEQHENIEVIGCAGAFETIANIIDKDNYEIDLTKYDKLQNNLLKLKREERIKVKGMVPLRVDLIIPGILLINFIIEKSKTTTLYYSPNTLIEGYIERLKNKKII